MNYIKILLFSSLLSSAFYLSAQQVKLEKHEKMGMQGLRFWYSDSKKPVALFNREITPKGDCFDIVNGYAFFTWYKGGMNDRHVMLSRLNLNSNKWVTVEFPYTNTLYTDTYKGVDYSKSPGGNSHRTCAVGISQIDGTIHMIFDQHAGELNYVASKKNIAFAPDSEFKLSNFNPKRDYLKPGKEVESLTYPGFITNDAGELILFYRFGTSRQGNMTVAHYDGNSWSDFSMITEGKKGNPKFNIYGGLRYFNGKLYFGGSKREYGSDIEFNQGLYFAESGQRGTEKLKLVNGNTLALPVRNPEPLKIAEPLNGNQRMGSSPDFVVTENGSIHFSAFVSGQGELHFYKKANENSFKKSSGSPRVSFEDRNTVYGLGLRNGKIELEKTQAGENNWSKSIRVDDGPNLAAMVSKYYKGKLYCISAQDVDSDKRELYFTVINLGNAVDDDNQAPSGSFIAPTASVFNEGYSELYVKIDAQDDKEVLSVALSVDGNEIRTETGAPYEWGAENSANDNELLGLTSGEHILTAVIKDNEGKQTVISKTIRIKEGRGPYLGSPIDIPGVLEAEYFDKGGQEEAYLDTDIENKGAGRSTFRMNDMVDIDVGNEGKVIGWTSADEWLEYTINVSNQAEYDLSIFYSSKNGGGKLELELDGDVVMDETSIPSTDDWSDYQVVNRQVSLGSGIHVLRVKIIEGGFNLDKLKFDKAVVSSVTDDLHFSNIALFPNPSSNGVFQLSKNINWVVYDLVGHLVSKGKGQEIDLSLEEKGVYILKANGKTIKVVRK